MPTTDGPASSLDHLPRQLTSFIGREHELRELTGLLENSRLLTLTGPGGSGKTRLGLQLAVAVADAFPDGVFYVALAPVGQPDLVLSSIAQGIGLLDAGDRPLPDRLHSHLRNARSLILLDNFEHLIAAAPDIAHLLRATAALRVVVTSRAPLHVSGEQEYEVPPLRVPDPQAAAVAMVADCESARAPGGCWRLVRCSAAGSACPPLNRSARRSTWGSRSWTDSKNLSTRACCAGCTRPAIRASGCCS